MTLKTDQSIESNPLDLVTLVDEMGQKIGQMDKITAHRGEGALHLACSVFLFRRVSEGGVQLLIQQRSPMKIVGQWQWANTICGNVRPTETPEECAHRRLREELTIVGATIQPFQTFLYQVRCNQEFSEYEFDHLFVGWYDGSFTPNPSESVAAEWLDFPLEDMDPDQQIRHTFLQQHDFAPWFRLMILDETIWSQLQQSIQG